MKLSGAIAIYVKRRHEEGSTFVNGEAILQSLCRRIGDIPVEQVSVRHVVDFLNRPRTSAITRKGKYSTVKCFLEFLAFRAVMPFLLLPASPRSETASVPRVFTHAQIRSLLRTTEMSQKNSKFIDGSTFRFLLLMLYATGAHFGEVLSLRRGDLDLEHGRITFRNDRPNQDRCIPFGSDLQKEFQTFLRFTNGSLRGGMLIFRAMNGGPLNRRYLTVCFRRLQDIAAVRRRDDDARPFRMRDFRPTFAVHRLTSWIKQGADLNNMIPALSAYMGYSGLATAEKFLSLTPERFRSELRKLCPQTGRTRWRDSSKLMHYLAEL